MKSGNRFYVYAIFSVCLWLFYQSCQDSKVSFSVNSVKLHSALDAIDPNIRLNENLLGYIVLPGEGCMPCIAQMEERLLQDSIAWKGFGLVFTRIISVKLLKQKSIGEKMIGRNNVYIDTSSFLDKAGFSYIYPSIIYLKSGQFDSFKLVQDGKNMQSFK